MKVLEGAFTGLSAGARIAVRELGLPVTGTHGVLIVFWKDQ
jgi:hypothetical protein